MLIAAIFTIDKTWKQPKCPFFFFHFYIQRPCYLGSFRVLILNYRIPFSYVFLTLLMEYH